MLTMLTTCKTALGRAWGAVSAAFGRFWSLVRRHPGAVSYTHLTLPTIYSV